MERGDTDQVTQLDKSETCPELVRCDAEVRSNHCEGGGNWRMRLHLPQWPTETRPGQFTMLVPGGLDISRSCDPLLPRPMAIYRTLRSGVGAEVEVRYKVVGKGTALLAEQQSGTRVGIVGPLGNGFPDPAPDEVMLIVAGGTGVASIYELAVRAADKARVSVLLGARSADQLGDLRDFEALSIDFQIATEDGSAGQRGLVTGLLEPLLGASDGLARVYACGPTPMMRTAAQMAQTHDCSCYVSLENPMACGFGVCLGCAVAMTGGGFALVCRDGPVFDAGSIDWRALS